MSRHTERPCPPPTGRHSVRRVSIWLAALSLFCRGVRILASGFFIDRAVVLLAGAVVQFEGGRDGEMRPLRVRMEAAAHPQG